MSARQHRTHRLLWHSPMAPQGPIQASSQTSQLPQANRSSPIASLGFAYADARVIGGSVGAALTSETTTALFEKQGHQPSKPWWPVIAAFSESTAGFVCARGSNDCGSGKRKICAASARSSASELAVEWGATVQTPYHTTITPQASHLRQQIEVAARTAHGAPPLLRWQRISLHHIASPKHRSLCESAPLNALNACLTGGGRRYAAPSLLSPTWLRETRMHKNRNFENRRHGSDMERVCLSVPRCIAK